MDRELAALAGIGRVKKRKVRYEAVNGGLVKKVFRIDRPFLRDFGDIPSISPRSRRNGQLIQKTFSTSPPSSAAS
jgi:hypothetical protein